MIRFSSILRRYSVPCVLIRVEETWNSVGEAIKQETKKPMIMPILPIDAKLLQTEGGRYMATDKAIYSKLPLAKGDLIEHKGGKHTIDEEVDYSEYADFNKYIAKRVSTHG